MPSESPNEYLARLESEIWELKARIAAAHQRCQDGKAIHSGWMDGRNNDTAGVINDMEHVFFSVRCYLDGAAGCYRPDKEKP